MFCAVFKKKRFCSVFLFKPDGENTVDKARQIDKTELEANKSFCQELCQL